MDVIGANVKYGTEAVLRYRAIAGLTQDSELPEIFLGGFIAGRMHDEMNVQAHVERLYTVIATDRGVQPDAELLKKFGGCRADVAIYRGGQPVAAVELKVFDDIGSAGAIIADRDKISELSRACGVDA